jgi:hypothetical protein
MCYGYSKDFGRSYRKETDRRPEARQETPLESPEPRVKPQAKAQDYTFWAFPAWRRSPKPHTPAAERSKESV